MEKANIFLKRIDAAYFQDEDVVGYAKDLLGKYLITDLPEGRTVGKIVETEAYRGPDDRACHAWNNRYTPRTKVMFEPGGTAYVYLCYGIHHLFNVVTGPEGMPHAVLIRAIEPIENIELMFQRRGMERLRRNLTGGPGAMSRALGIKTTMNGLVIGSHQSPIWIESGDDIVNPDEIETGTRIGVSYAGACAMRPWRFWIKNSPWVSGIKSGKNNSRNRSL